LPRYAESWLAANEGEIEIAANAIIASQKTAVVRITALSLCDPIPPDFQLFRPGACRYRWNGRRLVELDQHRGMKGGRDFRERFSHSGTMCRPCRGREIGRCRRMRFRAANRSPVAINSIGNSAGNDQDGADMLRSLSPHCPASGVNSARIRLHICGRAGNQPVSRLCLPQASEDVAGR
jgi:hypothetical protein